MSNKKRAIIIAACAVIVIVVIVLITSHPWRSPVSPPMYSLSVDISPSGAGSASPLGGGKYLRSVQVPLAATPVTGYRFANWTGDVGTIADVNTALTVISMNGDYSITANFVEETVEILDWHDLDAVRDNLDGGYLLMNDLDATSAGYAELASETANGGMGWEPIGTSDSGFTGNFNGQGYEIRDLFVRRGQSYVGLFGHVSWIRPIDDVGRIENVGMVNARVSGGNRVGVLVGDNAGIVSNSYSTGSATRGAEHVGGLVGYDEGGSVTDSYSTGNVTANRYVGGLVGRITGAQNVRVGTVRNCYSASSVTGYVRVGGLVGSTFADVSVSNSYFAGSVNGTRWVGGLVAENYGGNVSNSYSIGNVIADGGYVGGLVGFNLWGSISNCYATGIVNGKPPVGGLVGDNSEGTVNDSLWDTQTSGQTTSDSGTGKTTIEMRNMATFACVGWNIAEVADADVTDPAHVWNIVDGQTYPFLSWQS